MNGANNIGFDPTVPADTENAGLGDDRIRSVKTSVQAVLDDEHNFPSAAGNAIGYHRFGSARPYYGTQSRVSSDGTDSRLMLTSDTSRLFGMTSAGTVFLGGQNVLSIFTAPSTLPQRHIWVEESGYIPATGSSVSTVVYSSAFSGIPNVQLQAEDSSVWISLVVVRSRTTDLTISGWQYSGGSVGPTGGFAGWWRSLGTRAI